MSEAEIEALLKDYEVQLDVQPENERKVLGSGSYGTVINVKVNGAECVAKRIHDILLGTHGYESVGMDQWRPILQKFEKECKLLSKMRHPNVVQFIGVCELVPKEPRTLALVMERLHTDLGRYIEKTRGDISLTVKLNILHDTSSGLLYLHSHNVVHRDLNAGNVLLTESLQAKVADLGVSRVMDTMSLKKSSGNLTQAPGCLDYMPPEALGKKPEYGAKLDCFSFGHLMLYLIIEQYPSPCDPVYNPQTPPASVSVDYQIQKRQTWIDEMEQGHCLYDLVTSCLRDLPRNRPEMHEINQKLESLCKAHPQETGLSENFHQADQLLQQLTEITTATSKLVCMHEPMETNNLHKHVSDVKEQHKQILQTKNDVHCYHELLKEKLVLMKDCLSQLGALETHLLQHLAHLTGTEISRFSQLEEQVRRMQDKDAAKDLELQQLSEENQKLTVALTKTKMDSTVLQEEKNREVDILKQEIAHLEKSRKMQTLQLEQIQYIKSQLNLLQLNDAKKENSKLQTFIDKLNREGELDETMHHPRKMSEFPDSEASQAQKKPNSVAPGPTSKFADQVEQIDRSKLSVMMEIEAHSQAGELSREQNGALQCRTKENSEVQMGTEGLKSKVVTQKKSATSGVVRHYPKETDQRHNSETNQVQKNPNTVTPPPVPLKRIAKTPHKKVQRLDDPHAHDSLEVTKHPAPVSRSTPEPTPVHCSRPSLAVGLNNNLVNDPQFSDILRKRRLRSEGNYRDEEKDQPCSPHENTHKENQDPVADGKIKGNSAWPTTAT